MEKITSKVPAELHAIQTLI